MSFEGTDTKRLGWVDQVEEIYEILGKAASICNNIIGTPISDGKTEPKKEPSTSAEGLDDALRNLQDRARVVSSQLEDITDKF